MKKSIVVFLIVAFSKTLVSQCCPYVFSLTVLPSNTVSASSNIKIVTKVSTPAQGSLIYSGYTINGQNINIKSCYWDGFAASPLLITDTISIGTLAPGIYSVSFTAYASSIPQTCSKVDSNLVATTFTVKGEVITSVPKNATINNVKIYPNPVKDKLFISEVNKKTDFVLLNQLGETILNPVLIENSVINTNELKEGIYILKIVDGGKIRYMKFVKTE